MRLKVVATLLASCFAFTSAMAEEIHTPEAQTANDLLDLFSQSCMKNLGNPDGVKAWAADHHLIVRQNPEALSIYAGAKEGGALWAATMHANIIVLAIRTPSQACAVFADKADPQTVETYIGMLMHSLEQTSRIVTLIKDDQSSTPFGRRHGLMYLVVGAGSATATGYTVITNERPGGAYQVTVQVLASKLMNSATKP